jgi:formate-dependent nitrite reductase cytochrome c552 subunit
LVLSLEDIVELVRVFLPEGPNEARLIDQIETTVNKVVDLGFLQKLKSAGGAAAGPATYEVRRILKAFVDAQWLADFDSRLAAYQSQPAGATDTREGGGND